jgi:hypothetical protein
VNHRASPALIALLLLVAATPAVSDGPEKVKPRIEDLSARLEQGSARVSYRLTGVLSTDLEEKIQSGIPIRFKHRIDLKVKRGFPLMFDRLVARTVVETRVQYDTLTQRYVLLRNVEQRWQEKSRRPPTDERRRVTDSVEEMRDWLVSVDEIPVGDPAVELDSEKLRVRAEVNLGRTYFMWVIPTSQTISEEIAPEP